MAHGNPRTAPDVERSVAGPQPGEVDETPVRVSVLDRHREQRQCSQGALGGAELLEESHHEVVHGQSVLTARAKKRAAPSWSGDERDASGDCLYGKDLQND